MLKRKRSERGGSVDGIAATGGDQLDPAVDDYRWSLVERVAASRYLEKSARLRQFLLYICERSLAGHPDDIHEIQIGQRVYYKPADYNASEDNIVRVDARRLRKALDSYFSAEGQDEPVVITIPKGSYVPVFQPRAAVASEMGSEVLHAGNAEKSGLETIGGTLGRHWLVVSLAATTILLAAALIWEGRQVGLLRDELAARGETAAPAGILSAVFDEAHRTNIVVSDSGFPAIQRSLGIRLTLADYLNRSFGKELKDPTAASLARQDNTDFNSVIVVADLMRLAPGYGDRVDVRFPRSLELSELKVNHSILIGSRSATPFGELFADKRNFLYEWDDKAQRSYYRNRKPLANEQGAYYGRGRDGTSTEQYGVVSFLPNLGNTGNVLMLEGTTPAGTQAAWEFVKDPAQAAEFLKTVGRNGSGGPARYFEVLVRTFAIAGQSRQPAYVAHRVLSF
jgi:hypothetical protein